MWDGGKKPVEVAQLRKNPQLLCLQLHEEVPFSGPIPTHQAAEGREHHDIPRTRHPVELMAVSRSQQGDLFPRLLGKPES